MINDCGGINGRRINLISYDDAATPSNLAINTSPSDYRVVKEFRMMRFNGERWEPFGPIVAD
jgi:ABC-type branched-subunit amino acid transport system substrate-binding protein